MRRALITIIALGLTAILIHCSGRNKARPGACAPEKALPARLGDFARKSDIRVFDKENLWRFIDGAAETFLTYGFDKVATTDYAGNGREFSVEVYCFTDPLGAFGIYAENRTPDEYYVPIGAEGFVAPGLLMFFWGRYFVHVNLFDQELPRDVLMNVGAAVDSYLQGDDFPVQELARFPSQGRVEHSERYVPTGFLGSDSIASVLTAVTSTDSGAATLFFFRDPDGLGKMKSCLSRRGVVRILCESPYRVATKKGEGQEIVCADQAGEICFGAVAAKDAPGLASIMSDFAIRLRISP